MSESFPTASNPEQRIEDIQLARLGALMVEASMRSDASTVVEQHVTETGVQNPNSIGSTGFFVAGEVPMSADSVYRQVGLEAVEDLASSAVVRNGATAQGLKHVRWGDRVFWHPGDSRTKIQTGGRVIVEADKAAAEAGWVTADKVTGVYALDTDGVTKNIIPSK